MFKTDDPRLKFCMNAADPGIHFALVCGAKVKELHFFSIKSQIVQYSIVPHL